jgi:hypothetical protein
MAGHEVTRELTLEQPGHLHRAAVRKSFVEVGHCQLFRRRDQSKLVSRIQFKERDLRESAGIYIHRRSRRMVRISPASDGSLLVWHKGEPRFPQLVCGTFQNDTKFTRSLRHAMKPPAPAHEIMAEGLGRDH